MNNFKFTSGNAINKKSLKKFKKRRSKFGKLRNHPKNDNQKVKRRKSHIDFSSNNDGESNVNFYYIFHNNYNSFEPTVKYEDKQLSISSNQQSSMDRTNVTKASKATSTDNDESDFVCKQFQSILSENVLKESNASSYINSAAFTAQIRSILKAADFRLNNVCFYYYYYFSKVYYK